jgi:ABC-type transport system involved in Fe-S cluster assembly fused permease/ATPase subunit
MTQSTSTSPEKQSVADALRSALLLIWEESDRYTRQRLAQSFALLVAGSSLSALLPVAYKLIIDTLSGARPISGLLTPGWLIAAYVMCQLILSSSGAVRQLVHSTGTQRLNRRLSNRLFGHIVRLPLRFHLDRKTGAIGETLGQGLSGCQILLQHVVFTFLPVIVEFIAIVIVLIHFGHSTYLLIIGISAIAYGYAFWRAAEGVTEPSRKVSADHVNSHATLTDSLLNYETIKYFDGEPEVCAQYDNALAKTESSWRSLLRLKMGYGLVIEVIYTISVGLSLGYAGYEVLHKTMTIGDFVLVNLYVGRLYLPLQAIGTAARDMSQGLAFLQKMFDMLREKPEGGGAPKHDGGIEPVKGELSFECVSFSYKPDRQILRDVSFCVSAGRSVAIVGVSGSGKSSMIRLLFRLYEPDAGRVLLDGVPITDLPLSALRQKIAIVPQDTVLFNDTIGRNIAFGRPGATQEDVEEAAKLARLHTFISSLPEGYSTPVGERGLKLSGGEKQRVAIARAALKRPAVFVFDEATSSLDSTTELEILQNLQDISRRRTSLMIAHRLSTIVHADEILVLDHGTVIERGNHAALLERGGRYAALWRAQQGSRSERTLASASVA